MRFHVKMFSILLCLSFFWKTVIADDLVCKLFNSDSEKKDSMTTDTCRSQFIYEVKKISETNGNELKDTTILIKNSILKVVNLDNSLQNSAPIRATKSDIKLTGFSTFLIRDRINADQCSLTVSNNSVVIFPQRATLRAVTLHISGHSILNVDSLYYQDGSEGQLEIHTYSSVYLKNLYLSGSYFSVRNRSGVFTDRTTIMVARSSVMVEDNSIVSMNRSMFYIFDGAHLTVIKGGLYMRAKTCFLVANMIINDEFITVDAEITQNAIYCPRDDEVSSSCRKEFFKKFAETYSEQCSCCSKAITASKRSNKEVCTNTIIDQISTTLHILVAILVILSFFSVIVLIKLIYRLDFSKSRPLPRIIAYENANNDYEHFDEER